MQKNQENDNTQNIPGQLKASRKDLQLARRLIHLSMGLIVALIYNFMLDHKQAVYILGTSVCMLYIFEQVRINYPEYAAKMAIISKYFYRAEEQLKESAGLPFIMGILLTILSFPKDVALVAILTLAFSDPLSAIIGIKYGKRHIVKEKSLEGSLAFFVSCFLCVFVVYFNLSSLALLAVIVLSFFVALFSSAFEMIPIRLDDNLTIPLFTAASTWFFQSLFF